jgi:uncharacterized membrane protein
MSPTVITALVTLLTAALTALFSKLGPIEKNFLANTTVASVLHFLASLLTQLGIVVACSGGTCTETYPSSATFTTNLATFIVALLAQYAGTLFLHHHIFKHGFRAQYR